MLRLAVPLFMFLTYCLRLLISDIYKHAIPEVICVTFLESNDICKQWRGWLSCLIYWCRKIITLLSLLESRAVLMWVSKELGAKTCRFLTTLLYGPYQNICYISYTGSLKRIRYVLVHISSLPFINISLGVAQKLFIT